jgi:hypothetical protein
MDWVDLADSKVQWRVPVRAIMNLPVLQKAGNLIITLSSQEGLCSMELASYKFLVFEVRKITTLAKIK